MAQADRLGKLANLKLVSTFSSVDMCNKYGSITRLKLLLYTVNVILVGNEIGQHRKALTDAIRQRI
jgi:hypothetical protein